MNGRKIFAIHSIFGLVTGLLLLVISLSGSILVFSDEIDHSINTSLLQVKPSGSTISLDSIYRLAKKKYPASYIRFRHLPSSPENAIELSVEKSKVWTFAYYNPYTGEFLGSRNARTYLMGWLLGLHYSLLAGKTGELLVGVLSVTLILSLVTGFFVYRKHIRKVLLFKIPFKFSNWRKTSSSLHRILGVWSLVFNLLIAITGFWMMRFVFQPSTYSEDKEATLNIEYSLNFSIDELNERAKKTFKGFKISGISLPKDKKSTVIVYGSIPGRNPLYQAYSSYIEFNPITGKETNRYNISEQSIADKWDAIVYPLHAGLYGNLIIKIIYSVVGLSPALLSITGFLLWFRKKK